jgi:hypothetical protein
VIVDEPGPNTGDFIGAYRSPNPATAYRHTPIDISRGHGSRKRNDSIRIVIGRVEFEGTEIDHLVSSCAKLLYQLLLETKSTVISCNSDAHTRPFRQALFFPSRGSSGL